MRTIRNVAVGLLAACSVASGALGGATAPTARNGKLAYTAVQSALQTYSSASDGSGVSRVAANPYVEYEPVASPDGTRIAFVSSRDGNTEI